MLRVIHKFNILLDGRQKNRLFLLGIITLIGAFFEVLGVSLMIPLATAIMQPDIIETNATIAYVCEVFHLHSHKTFVILCIAALIAIYAFKNIYLMFEYYVQARFAYNNRFLVQKKLLHAYLNRPYEYYMNSDSGEILRNINSDVNETFNLLLTLLLLVTESVVSTALIITVFIVDPTMTVCIVMMMLLIIMLITMKVKPILRKKGNEFRKYNALNYRWLLQSVQGIKEVKVSNKEQYFEENFNKSGEKAISAEKWQKVFNDAPRLMIEAGCVCSTLAIIGILIYKGKPLNELIPALAAFAMAAVKLMPSANRIINAATQIAFHEKALDKLLENLNVYKTDNLGLKQSKGTLSYNSIIKLEGIVYRYPNTDVNVLDGASMDIPIGTSVGIVGRSGAGKTTAVDIMLGLLTPQFGRVTTDGVDVMNDCPDWLSHIGYIPQSIFMLNDDIKDNIAFGDVPDEERVWQALEDAQLADFVRELPEKLNTNIGERGIRLSGGQRQRIGIARALYNNPDILVFDEATSSLDNETEAAIMESINSLHGKKTMVIIAHRLQTIEECDTIYKVENGKIIRSR